MIRVSIDPKYKGGSVRMAAASAAIDRGVPIDVLLNTGRRASWQVFKFFSSGGPVYSPEDQLNFVSLAHLSTFT